VVVTFFTTGTDNTLPMVSCLMAGVAEVILRRARLEKVKE
jgi:hypothetical protein